MLNGLATVHPGDHISERPVGEGRACCHSNHSSSADGCSEKVCRNWGDSCPSDNPFSARTVHGEVRVRPANRDECRGSVSADLSPHRVRSTPAIPLLHLFVAKSRQAFPGVGSLLSSDSAVQVLQAQISLHNLPFSTKGMRSSPLAPRTREASP